MIAPKWNLIKQKFHVNGMKILVHSAMNTIYHKKVKFALEEATTAGILHWEKKETRGEKWDYAILLLVNASFFCLSATFHLWILTADDYGKEFAENSFIMRWDNMRRHY